MYMSRLTHVKYMRECSVREYRWKRIHKCLHVFVFVCMYMIYIHTHKCVYLCIFTYCIIVLCRAKKVNMTACNQSEPRRYKYVRVAPNFIFYNEDPVPLLPVSVCYVCTHACVCVCTFARVCTCISVCAYLRVCVYMRACVKRKNTADIQTH